MKKSTSKSSLAFENPIYDDGSLSDGSNFSSFESTELIENQIENLVTEEALSKIDIEKLNKKKIRLGEELQIWRIGPAPPEDKISLKEIKIGSICGDLNDKEEMVFDISNYNSNNNEKMISASKRALINYFAYVGTLKDTGEIDIEFVQGLLKNIGDSKNEIRDIYGQTIVHEVAREWHTDVAMFLHLNGVNIDIPDNYGRTPLYVAVAVNNTLMAKWLIENGANIHHRTIDGQGQTPMHFAAKCDSIECFDMLLKYGCDPLERDNEGKTPLFLAAEYGQKRMCSHLLELELPVASYSNDGTSAINNILSNLPETLAYRALNQFIAIDPRNGSRKYYMSCLGKRRWRLLKKDDHIMQKHLAPDPLEVIVERKNMKLIMHPVILKLLELKFSHFASKYIRFNVLLNILATLFWTVALGIIEGYGFGYTSTNIASLTLIILAQSISTFHIIKLIVEFKVQRQIAKTESIRQIENLKKDRKFVHPRWPIEQQLFEKRELMSTRTSVDLLTDGWTAVEILCLLMSTIEFILHMLWLNADDIHGIDGLHQYFSAVFVLILWIRLNRSLRYFQTLGPFIAMLGECLKATAQFAFLFFEFFIPFSASFWIIFGGERKATPNGSEYQKFNDMLYQLYLLTFVGDYEFQPLKEIDETTAQVLVGIYFLLVSIVSLNLYIALLSEAFARVNQTASAIAYLKEAIEIINIEHNLPEEKRSFEIYSNQYYAPLVIDRKVDKTSLDSINYRGRLVFCGQTARELNKNLEFRIKEAEKIVSDISQCYKSMKEFDVRYSDTKIEDLLDKIDDVFVFQTASISKVHRKTRSLFARLKDFGNEQIERIKEFTEKDDSTDGN